MTTRKPWLRTLAVLACLAAAPALAQTPSPSAPTTVSYTHLTLPTKRIV